MLANGARVGAATETSVGAGAVDEADMETEAN